MAIQTANLGTAPSGAGGDTFRSAATKFNENFTNYAHAASRLVGTQAGNVMEVGAFGLGLPNNIDTNSASDSKSFLNLLGEQTKFIYAVGVNFTNKPFGSYVMGINIVSGLDKMFLGVSQDTFEIGCTLVNGENQSTNIKMRTDKNTQVDPNGFIKNASPIVSLHADRIELNDEAQQQELIFEKLGVGDYLIKGSTGFAQEGWYIETPKDANGNVLFSVIYDTLENGDISVKTYKKKFDLETASIVADLTQPINITENRWIDIRLQALPPIEYEIPASKTPADFQPTGVAQAVSEMMNGTEQ